MSPYGVTGYNKLTTYRTIVYVFAIMLWIGHDFVFNVTPNLNILWQLQITIKHVMVSWMVLDKKANLCLPYFV